ncbi:MAG: alpha/beta hydrolase [Clostridiales bacterium]|nr:alpha/beta hydrolase [Clostridiales bacterium]
MERIKQKRVWLFALAGVAALCCVVAAVFLLWPRTAKTDASDIEIRTAYGDDVTAAEDVCYRPGEKDTNCYMDVAYQQTGEAKPLMVCVHGGSWTSGQRSELNSFLYTFSAEGYVVATIDYDLYPDTTLMGEVECVSDAVSYLVANAETYEIDPSNVVVLGDSAGAQLALRFAEEYTADPEQYAFTITAAIDIFGPTNLEHLLYYSEGEILTYFIEHPEVVDGTEDSDIITEIHKFDVMYNISSDMMPVLIVHGTEDATVPMTISDLFYDALLEAGVEVQYERIVGMTHSVQNGSLIPVCDAFLNTYVK